MYSYEDRIRAVKLYIKLNKRITATIIQLGYPTKNALKTWYREYEQRQAVSIGYVRSRPKYSVEQKIVAVDHYLDHDHCIASTIKALGYPGRETFTKWLDELFPESRMRVVSKAVTPVRSEAFKNAAVIDLCTRPPLATQSPPPLATSNSPT